MSESEFYEWLLGPEKYSGLSRNEPLGRNIAKTIKDCSIGYCVFYSKTFIGTKIKLDILPIKLLPEKLLYLHWTAMVPTQVLAPRNPNPVGVIVRISQNLHFRSRVRPSMALMELPVLIRLETMRYI